MMGKVILLLAAVVLFDIIWSMTDDSYPFNTEAACWDTEGNLIGYWSGYRPEKDTHPYLSLTDNVYLIKATGEKIKGSCKSRWGSSAPNKYKFTGEK